MRYYVVDAFADKVFEGNPAGVCILESEEHVKYPAGLHCIQPLTSISRTCYE